MERVTLSTYRKLWGTSLKFVCLFFFNDAMVISACLMRNNYYTFSYHIGVELCVFIFFCPIWSLKGCSSRVCFTLILRFTMKHTLCYGMILISVSIIFFNVCDYIILLLLCCTVTEPSSYWDFFNFTVERSDMDSVTWTAKSKKCLRSLGKYSYYSYSNIN